MSGRILSGCLFCLCLFIVPLRALIDVGIIKGIGPSPDAFGVLAGTINSEKFYLFMDYSTRDEILKLNAVLMF